MAIYAHQHKEFEKIFSEAEVDESHFGARRKRGFHSPTSHYRGDKSAAIYSNKWRGYDGLVDVGYDKHFRVNHGNNEFLKGYGIHINSIENFWSFTKRRLAKFNSVKKNFELRLKEYEWRYGRHLKKNFGKSLKNIITGYFN